MLICNLIMLTTVVLVLLVIGGAFARSVSDSVRLTSEQLERIRNWTEDDKQNIWELSGHFEGDIVLDPNQRNGLIDPYYRWPNNTIYYIFDASVSAADRTKVIDALKDYSTKTCIKPVLINKPVTDFVFVTASEPGCFSSVGRYGGPQQLNLQSGSGCYSKSTILHEFLHALGFFHQQSSSERDDYVTILTENIIPGKERNFIKYKSDYVSNFGTIYDYGSVMHYSAYAFSSNNKKTIVTKDPNAVIGQRDGLSATDIAKLKKMYNCP